VTTQTQCLDPPKQGGETVTALDFSHWDGVFAYHDKFS